jgi:electron transfer flavoprotein beta subunit
VKIAVLIKRVPDSEARIKIDPDGRGIDPAGVKFVMNPYDEYAVEEALALKEKAGAGEVVVFSLGVEKSQETLRSALAMGADRGVFLKTENSAPDPFMVAQLLATELEGAGFDLILTGKVAIDDYHHATGVMVAELLEIPAVSAASSLRIDGGSGSAEREIEGGVEVVQFALPALVTCDKGLNEPRYPALKGIMMAKKKPLEVKDVALADAGVEVVSLATPPARAEGRIVGEGVDGVDPIIAALQQEAKVL